MARFIHLTDLHVTHRGFDDPGLRSDTEATLRLAVKRIAALDPQPDFIIVSGDLANHGEPESYEIVKTALAPLAPPVLLALGNHDDRAGFHSVFSGHDRPEPLRHESIHAGIHVITVDSITPGHIRGAFTEQDAGFLGAALDRHAELPKLLVIHHPPLGGSKNLPWASLDPESTERLAATIAGREPAAIVSGHIHINQVRIWRGVPVIVSSGLHNLVDPLERKDMRMLEAATLGICEIGAEGVSVVYAPVTPEHNVLGVIDRERLLKFT